MVKTGTRSELSLVALERDIKTKAQPRAVAVEKREKSDRERRLVRSSLASPALLTHRSCFRRFIQIKLEQPNPVRDRLVVVFLRTCDVQ